MFYVLIFISVHKNTDHFFSPLHFSALFGAIDTFLQETAMSNAWYEVLSVLHLMAMLLLSQANLLLLPRTSSDGYQPKVTEGE